MFNASHFASLWGLCAWSGPSYGGVSPSSIGVEMGGIRILLNTHEKSIKETRTLRTRIQETSKRKPIIGKKFMRKRPSLCAKPQSPKSLSKCSFKNHQDYGGLNNGLESYRKKGRSHWRQYPLQAGRENCHARRGCSNVQKRRTSRIPRCRNQRC